MVMHWRIRDRDHPTEAKEVFNIAEASELESSGHLVAIHKPMLLNA
jgi:hypothetical protein